eukprot:COSAG02_NODE_197_length_29578_cov_9.718647_21_plen_66_part_01
MRLDCNDWNTKFVSANGINLDAMESSEKNTRVDAGGGYGGRVRLPWRLFLNAFLYVYVRCWILVVN